MPISGTICRATWKFWLKMPQRRITNEWIVDRFDEIYPIYRVAFARLLVILRRDFDGDLDAMLVLLTLSLGTDREGWAQALLENHQVSTQKRLTNTQSIALASGIPRETVRRKVVMLIERGYLHRNDEGFLYLTRNVGDDFVDMTAETVEHLLATARRLESLLAGQPTPLPPLRLD